MNILDKIVANKREEVALAKERTPISYWEQLSGFSRTTNSLSRSLVESKKGGLITEFKRKSPSKGEINPEALLEEVLPGYQSAGAAGISILADSTFFGACADDLIRGREFTTLPILRKEFILEEYQIIEARAMGADAILLIAAILEPRELQRLAQFAHSLDLEVLMEVHNEKELRENLHEEIDLFGVNNRDLKTFTVSTDISKKLSSLIPPQKVKISESGLRTPEDIQELQRYGFQGFLIGETFMREREPRLAAEDFIRDLHSKK